MTFDSETSTFLVAGPVRIHPRVLRAMSAPTMNHRGESFRQLIREIRELLPVLFGSRGNQTVLTGSGTAGLEALYSNLLSPEEKTIVLSNGYFSERSDTIVRKWCRNVTTVKAPWGHPLPLDALRVELEKGPVQAVCVVHNETSVGVTNDLSAISRLTRPTGALLLVDGISSVGGLPLRLEERSVDAIVGATQKGLAAPAGLALLHLSDRARERLHPSLFYLDIAAHLSAGEKNETPWTPAISLFYALREALLLLREEGMNQREKRTHDLAEATRAAAKTLDLPFFAEPTAILSDTVTALRYPRGLDDQTLRHVLQETYNVLVQGGQGPVKGKIFRIGHMGIVSWPDLLMVFSALEHILRRAGLPVAKGAGVSAISEHLPDP